MVRTLRFVDDADGLVRRVADGDRTAFEALYDGYHRLVFGIALKMLGDAAAAEDVTQGVFLKVWQAPRAFVGGNFAAWITRVTRNRSLDLIRGRAHRDGAEIAADLPDDEALDDRVFASLDAERVRRALATLPDVQRQSIELGFFSGLTHEEIARTTATPLGTVKARIRSGLRKLRATLEEPAS